MKQVRVWTMIIGIALFSAVGAPAAFADGDPFPSTGDGNRIPGSPTLSGTREQTPPSGDALGCPSGSTSAIETWTNDGHWEMYCVKRWTSPQQVNDDANRAAAEAAARASAEAEAAARPGVEICRTWSYTYSNGVSTAAGGVCTTVPVLTDGVNVADPTPVSSTPSPTRPTNPDIAREPWYLYEPGYIPGSCNLTVTVTGQAYSYTRPFSAGECAQRDIDSRAWQAQSLARERAQAQASAQPGIRICTPWTAAGQSGQECAFEPLRGSDQPAVSVAVTPIVADPNTPLNLTPGWQSFAPGITAGECGLVVTETNASTGVSFRRPYSITECNQRALDIAASEASARAGATAEAAARRTPGVEICTPWSAGSQSGRECRTRPVGLDVVIPTGESAVNDADLSITDGQVTTDSSPVLSPAQQVARTTYAVFRSQVLSATRNPSARSALTSGARQLDAAVPPSLTIGGSLIIPTVRGLTLKATSMTPAACRISGQTTVTAIKAGTCILSIALTYRSGPTFRLGQTLTLPKAR